MAKNNHNYLQLPELDPIQPMNGQHDEAMHLGQKLLHHGRDVALRIGPSNYGSMAARLNDVPSSSHAAQLPSYRVGNTGASQASIAHYPGSSSSHLPEPAPMPASLAEPLAQMPLSIGQSGWDGQQLYRLAGFERNVRARHNHNISLEPRPASTHTASSIYPQPLRSTASPSPSTLVARNPPISVPARTASSGAPGITSRALFERPYYPATGSSSSNTAVLPPVYGSSGNAAIVNGSYATRTVNSIYPNPGSSGASGSRAGARTVPHETVIPGCPPPGFTAAMRIGQPISARTAAPSRHTRHVAVGHASNGRHRRARGSYYALYPSMMEAEGLMLDQLVFYEPRAADPHRDMRLDVDNMSYEDLLALGEFIGNVNTGVAEDKISGCVREVVCCSSDPSQNDEDDGTCVVCLEDYKDKDLLGTLKCNHEFHADCIKKWLKVKNSCPVCKAAAA
ncbi:hypothetical protein QOZ80_1BG0059100 [Eleusine coracana subsp. coracana]|nr:hypothetical protein QOZ80_1BG0059100 [Eleusine coracana subsp. coracana]